MVGVVDSLEQSLQLPVSSPVHREQIHDTNGWPLTIRVRHRLKAVPAKSPSQRASVSYVSVVELSRLGETSDVVN